MGCTTHLLNVQWEHHSWHPEVSATDYITIPETNSFGRVVNVEGVRCVKHQVCEACGEKTDDVVCVCDKEYGEQCAPRLAHLAHVQE